MIREFAAHYLNTATIVISLCFIFMKIFLILYTKVKRNYLSVFFNSFMIYSNQAIRNTFDRRMNKYLTQSNKVNSVFYVIFGIIFIVYLLLWLIL